MGALKGLEDVGGGAFPGLRGPPAPPLVQPCGFCDSPGFRERLLGVVNPFSGALSGTGWLLAPNLALGAPWPCPSSPHHAVLPQCKPVEVAVEGSGDGLSWAGRLRAESLAVSVTAMSPVPGTGPIPTPT